MVIYVVSLLYTQCLRYNICSAWFLDIRISTCLFSYYYLLLAPIPPPFSFVVVSMHKLYFVLVAFVISISQLKVVCSTIPIVVLYVLCCMH